MYIKKYIQFFGILSPYYLQQPVEEKISPAEEKEEVQETEEAAHLSELSLLTSMSSRWKEKTPLFPVKVR